ncbi:ABC transporter ATP-binding protein [Shouchella patagoniensis]|uniref:ABC transporter ATP-binding protein n=1 Tax=Shouchella patagoniensis TaxID=228576 RepID=UPI0009955DFB|nr:ABC transporter ATP-binding protein [Shouchella patagoniensis]
MITFQNVQIKYGTFTAMEDLQLTINENEFFTLLGPSGCGKTTVLRSLAGFIQPSKGEILIDGQDVTNVPIEKRRIGMVFQSYALFPSMTVFENIAFGLKVEKKKKAEIEQRVQEIAEKMDLSKEQLSKQVSELSGGQQQRVAIARALILKPKILVLDEPLSNLDAKLRKKLRNELKMLQRDFGITFVYVTHDQDEALSLSDRIAVFNNGHIEQVGTPREIYNASATKFVCSFIGDMNELQPTFIQALNTDYQLGLDTDKQSYIRQERILVQEPPGAPSSFINVTATLVDQIYQGMYTKYILSCEGQTLVSVSMENGTSSFQKNDTLECYLNPNEILQY